MSCPHGQPQPYLCLDCCNQQIQRDADELERLRTARSSAAETSGDARDAARFRWLQAEIDKDMRGAEGKFSVYEHNTKVFELRTAIDICRGMQSAQETSENPPGEKVMPEQVITSGTLAEHHIEVSRQGLPPDRVRLSMRNEHVVLSFAMARELLGHLGQALGQPSQEHEKPPQEEAQEEHEPVHHTRGRAHRGRSDD